MKTSVTSSERELSQLAADVDAKSQANIAVFFLQSVLLQFETNRAP